MYKEETYQYNKPRTTDPSEAPDKGLIALRKTGKMPEGATLLTNISKNPTGGVTVEESVRKYEKSGFDVTVIEGEAFDKYGNRTGGHAIVGVKRKVTT